MALAFLLSPITSSAFSLLAICSFVSFRAFSNALIADCVKSFSKPNSSNELNSASVMVSSSNSSAAYSLMIDFTSSGDIESGNISFNSICPNASALFCFSAAKNILSSAVNSELAKTLSIAF